MNSAATVLIHPSQFPEMVRRDLLESLRSRKINHKFHYDSIKQTQKWLALHQAYAPSRHDADCAETYDRAFRAAAQGSGTRRIHVVGLGCGGGQKDTRLLNLLVRGGRNVCYTPCDVSSAMVLVARQTALKVLPEANCFPLVCDLATAGDLPAVVAHGPKPQSPRLLTFFGMIPNFEPPMILPKLAAIVRLGDLLLFSANLAPGGDYAAGMRTILPQYDNAPTRAWLLTFLLDLGVGRRDGQLRFSIESGSAGLKRIVARFHFTRVVRLAVEAEAFTFRPGDSVRLFFSYRHTPAGVRKLLARHGLEIEGQWITRSAEEGVFLCRRN